CPSCGATVKVPDRLVGKDCRCPKCDATFKADPPDEDDSPEAEVEAPGKRRKFKRKLRNLQTSRGPLILTAGITGLIFSVLSIPLSLLACCCSVVGVAGAGTGLAFSGLAGILGLVEMSQVARGTREPSGHTKLGMILGFCGVPLGVLCLV